MLQAVPVRLQHGRERRRVSAVIRVERTPRDDAREFSRGLTNPQMEPGMTMELVRGAVPNRVEEFMHRGRQVWGIVDCVLEC